MLGKLIKYEFKATARTFLPIYIALLLVAAINRGFRLGHLSAGFGISTLVLVGLFMALGVLTIIMIIQRFNKNLLGDEGYLMFTLPVSSDQLIISKLIISLVWTVISGLVAVITFVILLGDAPFFDDIFTNWSMIWNQFAIVVRTEIKMDSPSLFVLSCLFISLLSYVAFILEVYLSLAAAQLPVFNKHRGIIGFIAFFVINVILSICGQIAGSVIPIEVIESFKTGSILMILNSLAVCIVLYIGIKIILDKHLNLE